ncbi:MAG: hypothetical protein AAGN46_15480, partial [Acidobacteriota bacterium]
MTSPFALVLALLLSIAPATARTFDLTSSEGRVRHHVETLASAELEGRLTGSPGARSAAAYLIQQLEA